MHVILNADDFGRSSNINAAVMLAYRQGVLTSTSLMITGDAADEAVRLAREAPGLAVGLHVVVIGGRAALPPREIPHLVDARGAFSSDPVCAGLGYFLSRTAQSELARELEAQFERFAATGLPLSHVDGHMHMHLHPTVFNLLLPLAVRYGARGFRLPRDDLLLALRFARHRWFTKTVWALAHGLLSRRCVHRLRDASLAFTHRVYGLMQTGSMTEKYVVQVLRSLNVPSAEIYLHPAMLSEGERLGPNPTDLATLLSPAVRDVIESTGLMLATYADL